MVPGLAVPGLAVPGLAVPGLKAPGLAVPGLSGAASLVRARRAPGWPRPDQLSARLVSLSGP